VIRSVLTAELYEITHEFDIEIVIKTTLKRILQSEISLILCIDLKSLYDYLIKLETTQEKILMIDVMSLRQFYERREIIEVKWIHDHNNFADVMIKIRTFFALKTIINENRFNLDTTKWVERH
jgi:hypothetical protein